MHVRNIARGVEAHRGGKITRRFTMAPEPARVLHNCGLRCPDHQPPHYGTSASALPRCDNTAVYRVLGLDYRKSQRSKTHPGITSFFQSTCGVILQSPCRKPPSTDVQLSCRDALFLHDAPSSSCSSSFAIPCRFSRAKVSPRVNKSDSDAVVRGQLSSANLGH